MALILLAALAALEGLGLLAYAVFDIIQAVRVGITGPEEVSSPAALVALVAITASFGVGMLWVAVGWWRARSWARAPFVVAQLVLGLIGYELSQSNEDGPRLIGQIAMVVAVTGIVLIVLPSTRRSLVE